MRARPLALLASFVTGVAVAAGACGETLPSDQTSTTGSGGATTSSGATGSAATSSATTAASSGGMGGAGTGGAGTGGTGGALDCFPHPTTHVEIINACTTAQEIDLTPVLPLLNMDGTLPPLP
jgi:hypothetical protein